MFKKKFYAFTIIEIIVVITISGIVISTALMIYLNYQKLLDKSLKGIEQSSNMVLFDTRIQKDAEYSEGLIFKNNQFVFLFSDSSEIKYQFFNNFIVRTEGEFMDTIFIKYSNIDYDFCFKNLICSLEFDVNTNNNNFRYCLTKNYNNSTLVNSNFYNGN